MDHAFRYENHSTQTLAASAIQKNHSVLWWPLYWGQDCKDISLMSWCWVLDWLKPDYFKSVPGTSPNCQVLCRNCFEQINPYRDVMRQCFHTCKGTIATGPLFWDTPLWPRSLDSLHQWPRMSSTIKHFQRRLTRTEPIMKSNHSMVLDQWSDRWSAKRWPSQIVNSQ